MRSSIRQTRGDAAFGAAVTLLITLLTVLFVYPVWHVLMASFSDPSRILSNRGMILFPLGFSLEGYRVVLNNPNIWIGYGNTLFYLLCGTALNMAATIVGAFVLSQRKLLFGKFLTMFIVITMYISGGLIPDFLLVRNLGLYNSRWALLLPGMVSTWNLIVMRTAFRSVPQSLEESAMIDGASVPTILVRIVLPVSMATIMVMVLFYAVEHWNAWFNAMIYLRDRELFPLQLFLREILLANSTMGNSGDVVAGEGSYYLEELIKYCTIVISTAPILFIYPYAQRFFIKGVMLGSIKE